MAQDLPLHLKSRVVRCPSCASDSRYAPENPYRPFCSARCKGLDLGAWANETFRVDATPEIDPDTAARPIMDLSRKSLTGL